jgi:uncharacterized membrane protein
MPLPVACLSGEYRYAVLGYRPRRGQRAFFFALGYLGWFLEPLPLIATAAGVLVVTWRRQFASHSRNAVRGP